MNSRRSDANRDHVARLSVGWWQRVVVAGRRLATVALVGAAVAVLTASCGQDFSEIECVSSADCTPPLVCAAATCVRPGDIEDAGGDTVTDDDGSDDTDDADAATDPAADGDDTVERDASADPGTDVSEECGNGTIDEGEACDDGDANSDETPDACRLDCSLPRCGDGVVDEGENCDDGGDGACPASCIDPERDLCLPCGADDECGGDEDACVLVGEARACAMGCDRDEDCPAGYACGTTSGTDEDDTEQCLPVGDACEGCIDPDEDGHGTGPDCDGFDCAPSDGDSFPGATEICDGVDNDCDGEIDEGFETAEYWPDADDDGFGDAMSEPITSCDEPPGFTTNGEDCDDSNPSISPDGVEVCDGRDNDCSGEADDGLAFEDYWPDGDRDGFGDETGEPTNACRPIAGSVANDDDCDDDDVNTFPGATELCDEKDNDCDGEVDESTSTVSFWPDADGDGFGDAESDATESCEPVDGAVQNASDCDDTDAEIRPDAVEACDGVDNDCDGAVDRDATGEPLTEICYDGPDDTLGIGPCRDGVRTCVEATWSSCRGQVVPEPEFCDEIDNDCDGAVDDDIEDLAFYPDTDGDGFGDSDAEPTMACAPPEGLILDATDCDDTQETIHPAATELPGDEVDQNCDGRELCYADRDNDGYRTDEIIESLNLSCGNDGEAQDFEPAGDCDDGDEARNPGATERVGDEIDQDCDGAELCWEDRDDDGFRTDTPVASDDLSCDDAGEAAVDEPTGDCNDDDPEVRPDAEERPGDEIDQNCDGEEICYVDNDGDDYHSGETITSSDVECGDGVEASPTAFSGDCDDDSAAVNPGAEETSATDWDDDCDGMLLCRVDADGDGAAAPADSEPIATTEFADCGEAADAPDSSIVRSAAPGGDCDDEDPFVGPFARELCNGIDDDCDEEIDEALPPGVGYPDADLDGFGADGDSTSELTCVPPVVGSGRCMRVDDPCTTGGVSGTCAFIERTHRWVCATRPCEDRTCSAGLVCAGDERCVGPVDPADGCGYCPDGHFCTERGCERQCYGAAGLGCEGPSDQSGVCVIDDAGDARCQTETLCGTEDDCPEGWSCIDTGISGFRTCAWEIPRPAELLPGAGDCDDDDARVNPGAAEFCDGRDQNCDGNVDEGLDTVDLAIDIDEDGFGGSATEALCVEQISGCSAADEPCEASGGFAGTCLSVPPGLLATEFACATGESCESSADCAELGAGAICSVSPSLSGRVCIVPVRTIEGPCGELCPDGTVCDAVRGVCAEARFGCTEAGAPCDFGEEFDGVCVEEEDGTMSCAASASTGCDSPFPISFDDKPCPCEESALGFEFDCADLEAHSICRTTAEEYSSDFGVSWRSACVRVPPLHADNSSDCDDRDAEVNPGAGEICGNGTDDDCDELTDCDDDDCADECE